MPAMEKICSDSIYLDRIDRVIYRKCDVTRVSNVEHSEIYKSLFDVRGCTQKRLAIRLKSNLGDKPEG